MAVKETSVEIRQIDRQTDRPVGRQAGRQRQTDNVQIMCLSCVNQLYCFYLFHFSVWVRRAGHRHLQH